MPSFRRSPATDQPDFVSGLALCLLVMAPLSAVLLYTAALPVALWALALLLITALVLATTFWYRSRQYSDRARQRHLEQQRQLVAQADASGGSGGLPLSTALLDALLQTHADVDRLLREVGLHLTAETAEVDQLRRSLREARAEVTDLDQQVKRTVTALDPAGKNVLEVSGRAEAAGRTWQQTAGDLQGVAGALGEIQQQAESNRGAARQVQLEAEEGVRSMKAVHSEMAQMDRESTVADAAMVRLTQQTRDVGTITEVIHELVADTELLAFNAAIIAANAGEEGQAFGVIAEEVKELADRTTASARDIHRILRGVSRDTDEIREAVGATSRRIHQGIRSAAATGDALQRILQAGETVTTSGSEILRLTAEQSHRTPLLVKETEVGQTQLTTIQLGLQTQSSTLATIHQQLSGLDRRLATLHRQLEAQEEIADTLGERLSEQQAQLADIRTRLADQMAEPIRTTRRTAGGGTPVVSSG